MSGGKDNLVKCVKKFMDSPVMDILDFPVKVVLSPFTLPFEIAGSAPRGFGIPEFASKLSYSAIFDLDLPLNASSWSNEDLKDPKKLYEMTILLNAQREIADNILDTQWETKWREEKLNEMMKEKVEPYLRNIDNSVLPQPIVLPSQNNHGQKKNQAGFSDGHKL